MTAGSFTFICCALVVLTGALVTVVARNPMRGAIGLLLTILGIFGLFLQLAAAYIATVLLIASASTVAVLFLSTLVSLGADAFDGRRVGKAQVARTLSAIGLTVSALGALYLLLPDVLQNPTVFKPPPVNHGSVVSVAEQLFRIGIVPFEMVSVLILVTIIGTLSVTVVRARKQPVTTEKGIAERFFGGPVHPRDAGRPIVKRVESSWPRD